MANSWRRHKNLWHQNHFQFKSNNNSHQLFCLNNYICYFCNHIISKTCPRKLHKNKLRLNGRRHVVNDSVCVVLKTCLAPETRTFTSWSCNHQVLVLTLGLVTQVLILYCQCIYKKLNKTWNKTLLIYHLTTGTLLQTDVCVPASSAPEVHWAYLTLTIIVELINFIII